MPSSNAMHPILVKLLTSLFGLMLVIITFSTGRSIDKFDEIISNQQQYELIRAVNEVKEEHRFEHIEGKIAIIENCLEQGKLDIKHLKERFNVE